MLISFIKKHYNVACRYSPYVLYLQFIILLCNPRRERLVEISKTGYLYDLELIDAIELLSHDDENSSLLCITCAYQSLKRWYNEYPTCHAI